MLDALGDLRTGRCVLEWMSRGASGTARAGSSKIERGIEGLRFGDGLLQVVPIDDVLDKRAMLPTANGVHEARRRPGLVLLEQADPTAGLSFNLSLTDAQRAAREAVQLPYAGPEGGAAVVYEPDSADDLDSEDPDDD